MLPDLTSLGLFLQAIDTGSLSKAAKRSNLTLSAASRRIALLESQMGVQLLRRTTKGVNITPAGEALAFHARQLLSQVERLQVDLSDYADGSKGIVRMHATASALSGHLPRDLAAFAIKYPQISVDLLERRTQESIAAVQEGRTDIGVTMASDPSAAKLRFHRYTSEHLVAVVPDKHPLRGKHVAFQELLDYDIVGVEGNTPLMGVLRDAARAAGKPFRLRIQVYSFNVICRMIAANFGVGVLPKVSAESYRRELNLRLLPLTDRWATRHAYLCVRDERLSSQARAMLDHLLGS